MGSFEKRMKAYYNRFMPEEILAVLYVSWDHFLASKANARWIEKAFVDVFDRSGYRIVNYEVIAGTGARKGAKFCKYAHKIAAEEAAAAERNGSFSFTTASLPDARLSYSSGRRFFLSLFRTG